MALKVLIHGGAGVGKSFLGATLPSDPEHPTFIVNTEVKTSTITLDLFQPKIDDGSIKTFDAVQVSKDTKGRKTTEVPTGEVRQNLDMEKTAFRIEDAIDNLVGMDSCNAIIDNITTLGKGLELWLQRKTDTVKLSGSKPAMFEYNKIYNRIQQDIYQLMLNPSVTVLLMAHSRKKFIGGDPKKEEGFTNLIELEPVISTPIDHYINFIGEIRDFTEFRRDEIAKIISGLPATGRLKNVFTFTKGRIFKADRYADRFYDASYPNLRNYLTGLGVRYKETPGTILVPEIQTDEDDRRFVHNTYDGPNAMELPQEGYFIKEGNDE